MTPEGKVKLRIKKLLEELNIYYHMPVQNGMGAPTLDFICCVMGRYVAIEAKQIKGKTTLLQASTIRKIKDSGGAAVVVMGIDDNLTWLRGYLHEIIVFETSVLKLKEEI